MGGGELLDAWHRELGPGRGTARLVVDVHQHQLVGRGEVALGRVEHLVDEVDALGVVIQDLGGDAQRVAFLDLAIVGDVRFEHEGHAELLAGVIPAAAELGTERVRRLVEGHDVEAHIHMAVPVDPVGQDGGAVDVQGRAEIGLDQRIRGQFHSADRSQGGRQRQVFRCRGDDSRRVAKEKRRAAVADDPEDSAASSRIENAQEHGCSRAGATSGCRAAQ